MLSTLFLVMGTLAAMFFSLLDDGSYEMLLVFLSGFILLEGSLIYLARRWTL